MLSSWYWLPAATFTDWPAFGLATFALQDMSPQLTCAALPIEAEVWAVTTATAPERLTATLPEMPALTPTTARSSLLVAVTATPLNAAGSSLAVMLRGPDSLASPAGMAPDLTRVCDLPVPMVFRWIS